MEYTLLDYKTSFYRIFTHGLEASEAVEDEPAPKATEVQDLLVLVTKAAWFPSPLVDGNMGVSDNVLGLKIDFKQVHLYIGLLSGLKACVSIMIKQVKLSPLVFCIS